MFKRSLFLVLSSLFFLLLPMGAGQLARADCDPHGGNSLSGNAQHPAGWITSFGPIEISPPDEFVYGVIDGAPSVQQFTQLKAKLRNRITDHVMGPGTVTALARYHLRTNYAPNLSNEPPTKETRQAEASLSTSEPVAVSVIPADTPVQLVFDFSAQPIPAGITDLYFEVKFEGQLEGVAEPVTMIGSKDLNEPHHVVRWNNTDWFLINYQWHTGSQIRASQTLMNFLSENCWYMDSYVDPKDIELDVGFTAGEQDSPVYVVHYQDIPPGRFGRLIFLSDAELIWMHARSVTHNPDDTLYWKGYMSGVTNQVDASGFTTTIPYAFRGIISHTSIGWSWACPAATSISDELADEFSSFSPASTDPVAITTITFP